MSKHKFIPGLSVTRNEWDKLSTIARQFIRDAEAGHFRYLAENGEVCAWGALNTGNLFSMVVTEKKESDGGSLYTLS